MQPLGKRLLIEPIVEKEVKSEGGIILDPARNPIYKATIIEVGPEADEHLQLVGTPLVPGDVIIYNPSGGLEVSTTRLLILSDNAMLKL